MPVDKNDLVFRLIKDDLTHYRLVMGLERLGLVPEIYHLNTSEVIFELMGIELMPGDDPGFENYQKVKHRVMKYNIHEKPESLNHLADKIYRDLRYRKVLLDAKNKT